MSLYTVEWSETAEDQLADIWLLPRQGRDSQTVAATGPVAATMATTKVADSLRRCLP